MEVGHTTRKTRGALNRSGIHKATGVSGKDYKWRDLERLEQNSDGPAQNMDRRKVSLVYMLHPRPKGLSKLKKFSGTLKFAY